MAAYSALRQPRGLVRVNGSVVSGWVDFETEQNSFYQADTFKLRFAANALPVDFNVAWFCSQKVLQVELFAGFPDNPSQFGASDLKILILGNVDDVEYRPAEGLLGLSGRDLTALMIDTQTTEQYRNQTASEIATLFAKRHGLTPVVTKTGKLSGTYYQIDYARPNVQRPEWDVLSALANEEGMAVYVSGNELHFEPKPRPTDTPYVLAWTVPDNQTTYPQFGGMELCFSRNLTLAKDITVTYRSKNQRGKGFSQSANSALSGGKKQVYQRVVANKTPEELLKLAQNELKQLTQHELKMTAELPGDNALSITNIVQVTGTGTVFDTLYYPESIVRTLSVQGGYVMHLSAKNHSPEVEFIS